MGSTSRRRGRLGVAKLGPSRRSDEDDWPRPQKFRLARHLSRTPVLLLRTTSDLSPCREKRSSVPPPPEGRFGCLPANCLRICPQAGVERSYASPDTEKGRSSCGG